MNEQAPTAGTIVVGIDGSPASAAALRWATGLARARDAEIVLVHVIEPITADVPPLGLPRAVFNEADWRSAIEGELEGAWCQPLAATPVRHRVRVEDGRPGPRIVDIAREEHADLIAIGSSGRSGLAGLVRASTCTHVRHHAPCPVAVIPAPDQATMPPRPQHDAARRVLSGAGRS